MVIEKGYFSTRAEVMEGIRDSGYWPTTFISNKSPELPIHYHDISGYGMEGSTYLLAAACDYRASRVASLRRLQIHARGGSSTRTTPSCSQYHS